MHTVRNRMASRPPTSNSFPAGHKPPGRHDAAHVPRGSMAIPLAVAEESSLVETRAQRRHNPKGKKARKAAVRMAAAREVQALQAEAPKAGPLAPPKRKDKGKCRKQGKAAKARKPAPLAPGVAVALPETPSAMALPLALEADPLLEQCLAAEPALALTLPARAEPEPEVQAVRVLSLSTMPELLEPEPEPTGNPAPRAFLMPAVPEPLVEIPVEPAEPDAIPAPEPEPATALAALPELPLPEARQPAVPLPRARALIPARRQGLVDVIAFLLRDSGRRLARWSARRHKTRAVQAALHQAEARQLNLQRELEALDALRRNKG